MIQQLMAAGLSKQQATSATAETMIKLFMNEDEKTLIREAERQVSEMKELVYNLKQEYYGLIEKIESVSKTVDAIVDVQEQYGAVTEDKAKNLIALYGTLLSMNEKAGADGNDAVKNAGYITYAYLGGQAKRETTFLVDGE